MPTTDFRTMGCHARAMVEAVDPRTHAAHAALHELRRWFAARERALSRFDPLSDLARLNASGGADHVTDVLWAAVDVALRVAAETDGMVTPTILPALEAAGYDRTFAAIDLDPVTLSIEPEPEPAPDWRVIERDAATRSIRLPRGVRLDLGGTAKGWSADLAARRLARFGPALVDVGGDIAAGATPRREPWPIGVGDPPEDLVLLARGGIATSGRDFRRWRLRGREQHHIIDPRTGAPARTDVTTATVIAGSALDAEVAAKRVLIEGAAAGMAWIDSRADLAALVTRDDGTVLRSRRFASLRRRSAA